MFKPIKPIIYNAAPRNFILYTLQVIKDNERIIRIFTL